MNVKFRRLFALMIDYLVIGYFGRFILLIAESFVVKFSILHIILTIITMIITFNLFIRKDVLFGHSSIGKKIMGLKIYTNDGDIIVDKKCLIDRVFASISTFVIYPFMILLNNKSSGDEKFKTIVK